MDRISYYAFPAHCMTRAEAMRAIYPTSKRMVIVKEEISNR